MFDLPPKCPAITDKITGLFGWRHTYRVHHRHKDLQHLHSLHKTYSLNLPRKLSESDDTSSYHKSNICQDLCQLYALGISDPVNGMLLAVSAATVNSFSNFKDSDSCVIVHNLHSQSGILDPDDRLKDVADDRERIVASFEDGHGPEPSVPQGGGDGASGSSVGTGSPDIFRGVPVERKNKYTTDNIPHIEVTELNDQPSSGLGLQVRRGSEPTLHQLGVGHNKNQEPLPFMLSNQNSEHTKRWSAAPVCRSEYEPSERILLIHAHNINGSGFLSPPWDLEESEIEDINNQSATNQMDTHNSFSRSGRLSMQFLGDGAGYRWMDAAERIQANHQQVNQQQPNQYSSKSLPRQLKRKEPLGQAYESMREKNEEMLLIVNEQKGPLGLTAIPDSDNGGLLVQLVEPGSRAERGRLRRGDRILEINGTKLIGLSDSSVQGHLRKSLNDPELRVRVVRDEKHKRGTNISEILETGEKLSTSVATISPTRKVPGTQTISGTSLQVANTRKLGRRIEIALKKGPLGLGFSVTTRDNPAGGDCPIYIKNILPRGAAIEDGRLRPGDRLLEVDNIAITGKTQADVVAILRSTQAGATVKIVVSRQQELAEVDEREIGFTLNEDRVSAPPKPPPPVLPQKPIKSKPTDATISIKHTNENNLHFLNIGTDSISSNDSNIVFPWRNREVLTLHIPVHDTEKAGLGVSVKGKTGSTNQSSSNGNLKAPKLLIDGDLGIFIKSVINGGAASRDGRLKMNDQLLSVNGISLLGQSNAEAMETLRRAMLKTGGKYPGMITLTIARRVSSRSNSSTEQIDTDNSNTSEKSGATVIYLSANEQRDNNGAIHNYNNHTNNLLRQNNNNNEVNNKKRWSNPVLERLTGGTCGNSSFSNSSNINHNNNNRPTPLIIQGLRNESYYMATNDNWSPINCNNGNITNNSVLIEEDPEPSSPALPFRPSMDSTTSLTITNDQNKPNSTSTPTTDATYSSQLSLDTNPPLDAFSRDAVGRRSISEKHHAALDAKETGTYQRNKKLREEREREKNRHLLTKTGAGSVESLTGLKRTNNVIQNSKINNNMELYAEALDSVGELGPSLGLKKSSSLESLQTMVQEIQMSDGPRGPFALRTPRGRGREESLRAAVENQQPSETQPRKHWLLEDGLNEDGAGGFVNRNSPFQSSLNDRKHKLRQKKPSLLKGIGSMFRFGKHRKDGIVPTETLSDFGSHTHNIDSIKFQTSMSSNQQAQLQNDGLIICNQQASSSHSNDRKLGVAPPLYQPPPPVPISSSLASNCGIHKTDLFNHRYSHYVNYEELQQQISLSNSSEQLSESTLDQMRRQVMHQRTKVEEESRRQQHYHSQRSSRNDGRSTHNHNHRPISSYEYESVVQHSNNNFNNNSNNSSQRKITIPNSATNVQWNNSQSSGRNNANRGPFVTHVTIRDQNQNHHSSNQQPASQV